MDVNLPYGSFTLETDSDTDSDSDLKPNGYIVLHKYVHIAQTQTRILTPYFCTQQESKSVSVSETICGNVNASLYLISNSCHAALMILMFK